MAASAAERLNEQTPDLDAASQLRGIAPNFVHSLDAAALTLSLISAKVRGIAAFTSVHDAYGIRGGHSRRS
ncbi:DNA-directed RNA polymerase [Methylobacterium tarhaniae]|uniref:DNA-directed RNA polymerase n=1 Tax=Methylobacterium tarhaniae TaxID=1187852 RepID=UPI0009FAB498